MARQASKSAKPGAVSASSEQLDEEWEGERDELVAGDDDASPEIDDDELDDDDLDDSDDDDDDDDDDGDAPEPASETTAKAVQQYTNMVASLRRARHTALRGGMTVRQEAELIDDLTKIISKVCEWAEKQGVTLL